MLTYEEIVRVIQNDQTEEEDVDGEIPASKTSAAKAVKALNTAIRWTKDNLKGSEEILMLKRIRDRALISTSKLAPK
ncbi:unnamed protein product [Diabrotica balteata]|uniref:Uncharacterized protein n=1 Tax=Diabrotica balteata TaxID=107213 RepID=A0A9N9T1Z2_DIABA|nr:unnamed protein product [Diabrotica balteata]